MTTFGVLLVTSVSAAVVMFLVVVARGRRLRVAEEGAKRREAIARQYVECRNQIADFGALMEKEPLGPVDIADTSRLPHPKDDLVAAFRLVVSMTKEQPLRGQLQVAALALAQYQPGVGPHVLSPLHLPAPDVLKRMSGDDLSAAVLAGSADAGRWETLNVQADKDIDRIALAVGARLPARRR